MFNFVTFLLCCLSTHVCTSSGSRHAGPSLTTYFKNSNEAMDAMVVLDEPTWENFNKSLGSGECPLLKHKGGAYFKKYSRTPGRLLEIASVFGFDPDNLEDLFKDSYTHNAEADVFEDSYTIGHGSDKDVNKLIEDVVEILLMDAINLYPTHLFKHSPNNNVVETISHDKDIVANDEPDYNSSKQNGVEMVDDELNIENVDELNDEAVHVTDEKILETVAELVNDTVDNVEKVVKHVADILEDDEDHEVNLVAHETENSHFRNSEHINKIVDEIENHQNTEDKYSHVHSAKNPIANDSSDRLEEDMNNPHVDDHLEDLVVDNSEDPLIGDIDDHHSIEGDSEVHEVVPDLENEEAALRELLDEDNDLQSATSQVPHPVDEDILIEAEDNLEDIPLEMLGTDDTLPEPNDKIKSLKISKAVSTESREEGIDKVDDVENLVQDLSNLTNKVSSTSLYKADEEPDELKLHDIADGLTEATTEGEKESVDLSDVEQDKTLDKLNDLVADDDILSIADSQLKREDENEPNNNFNDETNPLHEAVNDLVETSQQLIDTHDQSSANDGLHSIKDSSLPVHENINYDDGDDVFIADKQIGDISDPDEALGAAEVLQGATEELAAIEEDILDAAGNIQGKDENFHEQEIDDEDLDNPNDDMLLQNAEELIDIVNVDIKPDVADVIKETVENLDDVASDAIAAHVNLNVIPEDISSAGDDLRQAIGETPESDDNMNDASDDLRETIKSLSDTDDDSKAQKGFQDKSNDKMTAVTEGLHAIADGLTTVIENAAKGQDILKENEDDADHVTAETQENLQNFSELQDDSLEDVAHDLIDSVKDLPDTGEVEEILETVDDDSDASAVNDVELHDIADGLTESIRYVTNAKSPTEDENPLQESSQLEEDSLDSKIDNVGLQDIAGGLSETIEKLHDLNETELKLDENLYVGNDKVNTHDKHFDGGSIAAELEVLQDVTDDIAEADEKLHDTITANDIDADNNEARELTEGVHDESDTSVVNDVELHDIANGLTETIKDDISVKEPANKDGHEDVNDAINDKSALQNEDDKVSQPNEDPADSNAMDVDLQDIADGLKETIEHLDDVNKIAEVKTEQDAYGYHDDLTAHEESFPRGSTAAEESMQDAIDKTAEIELHDDSSTIKDLDSNQNIDKSTVSDGDMNDLIDVESQLDEDLLDIAEHSPQTDEDGHAVLDDLTALDEDSETIDSDVDGSKYDIQRPEEAIPDGVTQSDVSSQHATATDQDGSHVTDDMVVDDNLEVSNLAISDKINGHYIDSANDISSKQDTPKTSPTADEVADVTVEDAS